MEIKNLIDVKTRQELRDWFEKNGKKEEYCWVVVSMREQPETLLYLDVVEDAICFGWIDSTRKKLSDTQLVQRLSPRLKSSNWTELNKERVRRLERLGLMTDAGRRLLPENMDPSKFEICPEVIKALKEDPKVYKNFLSFPELYRRVRVDTIQSRLKRNEPELFEKRLNKLIECTKANKMYGDWNDNGRLLEEIIEVGKE